MFIFDQPYQYFDEPWPHIVIENVLPKKIADHMLHNWPETNVYNESHTQKSTCWSTKHNKRDGWINGKT